jgi:hypothetical protein
VQQLEERLSCLDQKPCHCGEIPAEFACFHTQNLEYRKVGLRICNNSGKMTQWISEPQSRICRPAMRQPVPGRSLGKKKSCPHTLQPKIKEKGILAGENFLKITLKNEPKMHGWFFDGKLHFPKKITKILGMKIVSF